MVCNVNMLRLIQLGLTFFSKDGKRRPGTCTWQFNFKFSLSGDMYAQDSVDMLAAAGLDFRSHETRGIDQTLFAERIMMSGLVLNPELTWVAFHGGYDFGYLLRAVTGRDLPDEESEFFDQLKTFFPRIYDTKVLLRKCDGLHGGLQHVADRLKLVRLGTQHQAGSDSHLTGELFFALRKRFFKGKVNDHRYNQELYGLGLNVKRRKQPMV
eukprot:TRINITY_DN67174_c2_g1_i4.p1 TRINITY_DN67174_c2_g1~~TRINITY_DN67174_c2_g1_i4.p1  ORF type:complete len:211 (+),score=76.91 TRINITY_DN67174_c2_g1_i4:152-784(+)